MATTRNPAEGAISGLSIRNVSQEEMLIRTARFKDLKSSREAFVDSRFRAASARFSMSKGPA